MVRFDHDRKYGIEIEFPMFGRNREPIFEEVIVNALRARGLSVGADQSHQWRLKRDPSAGWELVSPPMRGVDGSEQLQRACEALAEVGAHINTDCGLHVHHDAALLTIKQKEHLVYLWSAFQPAINEALAPSRQRNQYCRPLSYASTLAQRSNLSRGAFDDNRYQALNMAAYRRHGTIEFRQHQGSTNYARIWAWVVFTQAFVTVASLRQKKAKPSLNAKGEWRGMRNALGLRKSADACPISFAAMSQMNKQRLKFQRGRGRSE